MKRRSLKSKFVLSIFLLVFVVLIAAMSVTLALSIRVFRDVNEQALEQAALLGQQEVASWFAEKEQHLEMIRSDIEANFRLGQKDLIEAELATFGKEFDSLEQVFIGTVTNEFYSSVFWQPEEGYDCRTRDWYTLTRAQGGLTYTPPYLDLTTRNIVVSLTSPISDADGRDMGVVGIDLRLDTLVGLVDKESIMNTSGRAFLLDSRENFITHVNQDFLPSSVGEVERYVSYTDSGIEMGKNISDKGMHLGKGRDWDGVASYIALAKVGANDWSYGFAVPVSDFRATYFRLAVGFGVIILVATALSILVSSLITGKLLVPIQSIIGAAGRIAVGDVDLDLDIRTGDELEELSFKFNQMAESTSRQIAVMEAMASGDFSGEIEPKSDKDRLSITINSVIRTLNGLVGAVQQSSYQVALGVTQIAEGSNLLASGSAEQSAAIEQLSQSLHNILVSSKDTAESARRTSETVLSIRQKATTGTAAMDELVREVQEINSASLDITKVIKVIEDIAFRTSILALNAAVEASHAGQHGKGFAVVAEEVRSLAAKSADAAKETARLIKSSATKARDGVEASQRTQQILSDIVDTIDGVVEMVQHIDGVCAAQMGDIDSIAGNVAQISQVAHQNSTTAQQSAAAGTQLNAQAQELDAIMSAFKTGDGVRVRPRAAAMEEYA